MSIFSSYHVIYIHIRIPFGGMSVRNETHIYTIMSFIGYKSVVSEGDTVIIYLGYKNMSTTVVRGGNTTQTKYGAMKHTDLIGRAYGSRVTCSKGFVHILHPTAELWTQTLLHRTQILYPPDISLIILNLDLKPGHVVLECGTGSGSLSHALIRSVLPTGHLYTFDFHKERVDLARSDFDLHGLSDHVSVAHRDINSEGFQMQNVADSIFLDVPQPWLAVPSAVEAFKASGRLCTFSPCIEQVQKTCLKISEYGFRDIETVECIQRQFDPKIINMPLVDMGDYSVPNPGSKAVKLSSCPESSMGDINLHAIKDKRVCTSDCTSSIQCHTTVLSQNMLGHTGYLTFATLYKIIDR